MGASQGIQLGTLLPNTNNDTLLCVWRNNAVLIYDAFVTMVIHYDIDTYISNCNSVDLKLCF